MPSPRTSAGRSGGQARTSRPTRNARRAHARKAARLVDPSERLEGKAERVGVALAQLGGEPGEYLRPEMPADAPAPQPGRLGKEREIHPRAIHVYFERRGQAGARALERLAREALQVLHRLAG